MRPKHNHVLNQITVKIGFVGFLVIVLLIPLGMVRSLIHERQKTAEQAETNILSLWGGPQTIGGPVLCVPFRRGAQGEKGAERVIRQAVFLPDVLSVDGRITTEIRYRGIFEVPVYTARLSVSGSFDPADFTLSNIEAQEILWDRAFLSVGVTDPRGIKDGVTLNWGDETIPFGPRKRDMALYDGMIQCPIEGPALGEGQAPIPFSFDLTVSGGKQIRFLPLGRETDVTVSAPWRTPSFQGAYLPQDRSMAKSGFSATWRVLELGRNFPHAWAEQEISRESVFDHAFGLDLYEPVDVYQMTERSAKYAVLFIGLTFLGFFLFELFGDRRIHPIQYLMVGAALCVFYLLELSLSEHISFVAAYAVGAVGTVGIITMYSVFVLGQAKRALTVMGILALIYAFLFVLLQAEDYALVLGSLGLFAVLGIVMYLTRGIDWYAVGRPNPPPVPQTQRFQADWNPT